MKRFTPFVTKFLMLASLICGLVTTTLPAYADGWAGIEQYRTVTLTNNNQQLLKARRLFRQAFKNKQTWFEFSDYDFTNIKLAEYNGQVFATMSQYGNVLSTITIQLDSPQLNVFETYFSDYDGKFAVEFYHNGEFVNSEITDVDFMSNEEVLTGISELQYLSDVSVNPDGYATRGLDIGCFTAVTGAGLAVAGLIAKVCGMPCVATPPVCIACLGGIVVVGGGSIVGAVWICWK